jgi:hypothetical protein
MDDRELLEMAAKAAGYIGRVGSDQRGEVAFCIHSPDGSFLSNWRPLTDDGDALRLAMTLGMRVQPGYVWLDGVGGFSHREQGGDKMASTRLCIVRASAAIGKDMP